MSDFDFHTPLSRRQFLRRLGIAGGGVLSLSLLRDLDAFGAASTTSSRKPQEVVIIGAGLAGLCAAYELEKRGHKVTILEADKAHIGGRARTLRFENGLYAEAGAMRIPTNHTLTRHYIKELGLPLRRFVQSNPNAYYFVRGHKIRIKDVNKLNAFFNLDGNEKSKSPDDLWSDSAIALLKNLSQAERDDLSSVDFQTAKIREVDALSLRQLLERAGLSPEAIEMLTTAYALETSLDTAATESLREEVKEVWTRDFDEIVGGTDRLPAAFAAKIKGPIARGCQVIKIEQNPVTKRAAALYIEDGKVRREEGDWLICTLPFSVLSQVEIEPLFSGGKMRAIRELGYDSSTKVLAVCNRRFWETDDGIFGGGTYTDLPTGTTYYPANNAEARNPLVSRGAGVMLASYTWGLPARRLGALSPAERHEVVLRHISQIHPQLNQAGVLRRMASWSWDNFKWSNGAFAWFEPGQHSALYKHIVSPEGRVLIAGEHASLTHTWMQGAFESALEAVKPILGENK
jgi:monoamine oxidase